MTEKRMTLRSAIPKEVREAEKRKLEQEKLDFLNRPTIAYKGRVKYFTTFPDVALACDQLLKMAVATDREFVVGFDMEWPFSFVTGPGKTAVIQISPTLDDCYIFHVSNLKKLPATLTEFLVHPKVRLTGINIKNDIRKLGRDFGGVKSDDIVNLCIDLGVLANSVSPLQQRWSMEKLVEYFFKMRINKDKKVRMSKWHVIPLSREQKVYAAIDAYASLKLYLHLKELEKMENAEQDMNALNR